MLLGGCSWVLFLPFLTAHDGDSVIIVDEQKSKKQDSSRLVFLLVRLAI